MSTIRHPGLMVADGYEIYPILFLGQADLAELLWRNYFREVKHLLNPSKKLGLVSHGGLEVWLIQNRLPFGSNNLR